MTGSFYKTLLATLVLTSFSIISALPPEEEKTEEQVNADSVPISEKIEVKTKKSIDEKGEIKDVDIDYEAMKDKSTAVFYGTHLPTNVLSQYKRIIVEPDNVKAEELMALRSKGGDVFAYVSIGEISPSRKWYKKIQKDWILGDNKVWDSKVMDLASSGWQDFLIDSVIAPLWEDGYRGLFLDTMDSFYIFAKNAEEQKIQTDALTALMKRINERFPDIRFISNRGFEVLPSIGDQLEAVLAESLFSSWDNVKKEHKETSKSDQEWLLGKLNGIKSSLHVDIIVIDYLALGDQEQAKERAEKIAQEGFIPWVSIPSLDVAGVGNIEPEVNTHLLLTDSKIDGHNPLKQKKYHKLLQRLKDKGQHIKVHDTQTGMPIGHMSGRYLSIVSNLPFNKQSSVYKTWVINQAKEGAVLKGLSAQARLPEDYEK